MNRRTCPKCKYTGHMRGERVIKANRAVTEFTCHSCGHVWTEPDKTPDSPPPERGKKR